MAARGREVGGILVTALSAAVKYPAGALVPVVWVWSWKRGEARQRLVLGALAAVAAALTAAVFLLFAGQIEVGRDAAIGRAPVRSAVALFEHALQPVLGSGALSAARVLCWCAFLAVLVWGLRRLNGSQRSLFQVAFWVMAAITLLTVRQIYPSYLIWFICLGAILVGSVAWEMSILASISGLLSNLVFTDWATWGRAGRRAVHGRFRRRAGSYSRRRPSRIRATTPCSTASAAHPDSASDGARVRAAMADDDNAVYAQERGAARLRVIDALPHARESGPQREREQARQRAGAEAPHQSGRRRRSSRPPRI